MPILHLGVVDIPYVEGGVTTGDVAEILEARYRVMETFYNVVGAEAVSEALGNSIANAFEARMSGAPETLSLTAEAEGELSAAFRLFLDQKEMDGLSEGVPTKASIRGVNHRLANPTSNTNPSRPSFVDTGLYASSMRAWVEE